MEYKGKYNNELMSLFNKVYKTLYPDGIFKWGVDNRMSDVKDLVKGLTSEQLLKMFPDLWDIKYESWSEYYVCLTDNNEEVLNIGLYREEIGIEDECTHSIEYFIGGDLANNIGGQMIDCICLSLSRESFLGN